jgi:hypothetical protein
MADEGDLAVFDQVSVVVQNIFQSFLSLGERVHIALRTQLGDAVRLIEHERLCLQFLDMISQVHLQCKEWITALDAATASSSDPPDAPPLGLGTRISQGSVGRPPIDIDPADLAILNVGRVSHASRRIISLPPPDYPPSTSGSWSISTWSTTLCR